MMLIVWIDVNGTNDAIYTLSEIARKYKVVKFKLSED